jgi:hypothetical protein
MHKGKTRLKTTISDAFSDTIRNGLSLILKILKIESATFFRIFYSILPESPIAVEF